MAKLVIVEAPVRSLETPSQPKVAFAGVPAEVVAAISGAVAAMLGGGAAIMGIKPAKREKSNGRCAWSTAGLLENTRAF